jgi:hypothetical protein
MRRIQKRIYYWVAPDGVYGLPFCNLVSYCSSLLFVPILKRISLPIGSFFVCTYDVEGENLLLVEEVLRILENVNDLTWKSVRRHIKFFIQDDRLALPGTVLFHARACLLGPSFFKRSPKDRAAIIVGLAIRRRINAMGIPSDGCHSRRIFLICKEKVEAFLREYEESLQDTQAGTETKN